MALFADLNFAGVLSQADQARVWLSFAALILGAWIVTDRFRSRKKLFPNMLEWTKNVAMLLILAVVIVGVPAGGLSIGCSHRTRMKAR